MVLDDLVDLVQLMLAGDDHQHLMRLLGIPSYPLEGSDASLELGHQRIRYFLVFLGENHNLHRLLAACQQQVHSLGEGYDLHIAVDHIGEGLAGQQEDGAYDHQVTEEIHPAGGYLPVLGQDESDDVGASRTSALIEYHDDTYSADETSEQTVKEGFLNGGHPGYQLRQHLQQDGVEQDAVNRLESESPAQNQKSQYNQDYIDRQVGHGHGNKSAGGVVDKCGQTGYGASDYSFRYQEGCPAEAVERQSQGDDHVLLEGDQYFLCRLIHIRILH